MGCIPEDDLLEYVEHRLASGDVAEVEAHLRRCDGCRRALAELARLDEQGSDEGPEVRYEALEPIGAGGMGVVYRARDRVLRRTVALKMLQPGGDEPTGSAAARERERLLREARAMARLSHPNVLGVYDVGEHEGRVFLAMELVEGRTLGAWLREARRSWREVLDVFLDAARGLSAAHAAGLIHRDFKPENVLVGRDGRVRVTDFGLASAVAPRSGERVDGVAADGGSATASTLAGSPAYMAPEQLRGDPVDARADVFGFCVALHEALHGERPFRGSSVAELEQAIQRGELQPPRRDRPVPGWLRRTVARGLRHDPADRFQTMSALSDALARGRAQAGRRTAIAVALVCVAALGAALAAGTWRERRARPAAGEAFRSVAVLPLAGASGGGSDPPLNETLTEALTSDLGRTQGLRVTSRRSASALAASGKEVADVGRELGVDAVVGGSVRRTGNQVQVDLQVTRVRDGARVWAGRIEGDARDGFALEDRAARALREAIAPSAGGDRPRRRPTSSREAFDAWLAGKVHLRRENEADQADAIRLLERAVALDPDFPEALAALALAQGNRFSKFTPGDAAALERAEALARRALELAPDLAEAHYAAAQLIWGVLPDRFAHERAVQEVKRAIALDPNLAAAHHYLGLVYLHIGLLDEAKRELDTTLLLDPTDSNALRRIGVVLAERGSYEQALRTFQQVPKHADTALWSYDVAWTLQHLGRADEARAIVDEYLRGHPGDRGGVVTSVRAILRAKAGDEPGARADIGAALDRGKGFVHFHHTTYNVASAYALLGNPREAVRWLRVTADTGWPCYPLFASDPNLLRLHGDPSYAALMGELKARWERYREKLAP